MKIPKIYSGEYLCCLPPELYRSIIDAVELAISKLYLSDSDKKKLFTMLIVKSCTT